MSFGENGEGWLCGRSYIGDIGRENERVARNLGLILESITAEQEHVGSGTMKRLLQEWAREAFISCHLSITEFS